MPEEKNDTINDEIIIETGCVTLCLKTYNELIGAAAKLKIIEHMYRSIDHFDYDKVLSLVFGAKGENDDAE